MAQKLSELIATRRQLARVSSPPVTGPAEDAAATHRPQDHRPRPPGRIGERPADQGHRRRHHDRGRRPLHQPGRDQHPQVVDLNRITFIDSSGLGVLSARPASPTGHGGSLHVVCSRPQIRRLRRLTGVDRRIPLAVTVDGR